MENNYEKLEDVLSRAKSQAAEGKGVERHADGQPFEKQPIVILEGLYQSGNLFQAAKKMHESQRLPLLKAIQELLGAINYIAARVIYLESKVEPPVPQPTEPQFSFLPKRESLEICENCGHPRGEHSIADHCVSADCSSCWDTSKFFEPSGRKGNP